MIGLFIFVSRPLPSEYDNLVHKTVVKCEVAHSGTDNVVGVEVSIVQDFGGFVTVFELEEAQAKVELVAHEAPLIDEGVDACLEERASLTCEELDARVVHTRDVVEILNVNLVQDVAVAILRIVVIFF